MRKDLEDNGVGANNELSTAEPSSVTLLFFPCSKKNLGAYQDPRSEDQWKSGLGL